MKHEFSSKSATAKLVAGAISRDRQACDELVSLLYPLVAKIVRPYAKRSGNEQDWEQEVFLRFFARLPQFRGESPIEHWTAKLAVNVCLDLLRKRSVRRELRWADLGETEATLIREGFSKETSIDECVASRDLADRLLESLAAEDQVILRMLDMEERSVAEIADFLGRTQSAVKVRAMRARRKLENLLSEWEVKKDNVPTTS